MEGNAFPRVQFPLSFAEVQRKAIELFRFFKLHIVRGVGFQSQFTGTFLPGKMQEIFISPQLCRAKCQPGGLN